MRNRQPTPGKEGRVLITPEDGSPPFYAKLEMADDPLDPGTPLNKATLLSDTTADLIASGGTPPQTVNEALMMLYTLFSFVPAGSSRIIIRVLDEQRRPIQSAVVLINGTIIYTNSLGVASADNDDGEFSIELFAGIGYSDWGKTQQFSIPTGSIRLFDFVVSDAPTGDIIIKNTASYVISSHISSVDACVVGAGGNGAEIRYYYKENRSYVIFACGGAGGYVKNELSIPVSGGFAEVVVGKSSTDVRNSILKISGRTIQANGGNDGFVKGGNFELDDTAPSGGCGVGGGGVIDIDTEQVSVGKGGENGSNGEYPGGNVKAGAGQSDTTRAFGTGELYSGAAAALVYIRDFAQKDHFGQPGAGGAVAKYTMHNNDCHGEDATVPGGGGGLALVLVDNNQKDGEPYKGMGGDGIVRIRW